MNRSESRIRYAVKLSRHIKGFGWYLFFSILCNAAFKVLPLLTGLVTSYLAGSVLLGHTERVVQLLIASGILIVLTALFAYLDVQVSHDMAYRILTELRDLCYQKLDELAPAAMLGQRSGDLMSIILGDVENLEWFYAHTIGQLVVAVAIPAVALVFMGTISPLLPLIILPFIAALILVPRHSAAKSNEQGTRVKRTMGTLHAIIIDGIQGMKDIISFRWQEEYLKRFFHANQDYAEASMAYAKRRANESRSITLLMEIASLTANIVTTLLVVSGRVSPLWLLPLLILSSAIFSPIRDALAMSTNYGLIFGAAKRVLDLLAMKPLVADDGRAELIPDASMTVRFEQVFFTYPSTDQPVLRGLDFSFHTGETVALVGASGAGKSTVAKLLQRFWEVDDGRITINGQDIRECTLDSLRKMVTVVPQEVYLFNTSVADNLRLADPNASQKELEAARRLACADGFIAKLPRGYDTLIGERGLRLSGGEKQRLSLAQAFLKNSPIIVLDEASANLDAENERLINQAVMQLKEGRATLVIAHRISTIRQADVIVVLKDGEKVAQGTYDELLACCPFFQKLIGDEYEHEYRAKTNDAHA